MKRAGIVLCGGLSRRMGRPKALLPWFGRSMVEHVLASLVPAVDECIVVTSEGIPLDSLALDARIVVDREPDRGPLAGIRDGLAAARADCAFVTSCDVPFLTGVHIERLFEEASAEAELRAVAPVADGFVQVLGAVYPACAWRVADDLLAQGFSSPTALLERIGFARFAPDRRERGELAPWAGFNTPEAYLALARHREPAAIAIVDWEGTRRTVAIGRLADVLESASPASRASHGSPTERLARGELHVVLVEGALPPAADPGLPIGPGERVSVFEAPRAGVRGTPSEAGKRSTPEQRGVRDVETRGEPS